MSSSLSQWGEWIAQARAGDADARDRLFGACRSFVAVAARVHMERRLQAKVDASDLVQQSLLEAHRGFDGFAGDTPQEWLGWLKQIVAHNAADVIKHYRGAEKRDVGKELPLVSPDTGIDQWDLTPADPSPSPSQIAIGLERELILADALEQLPEDYREILILRSLQRLSFDEVANRMGRSRGACQMLWMRAVERLREMLGNE
ncbi:MAG: sigma-70 family RNA polymerase sigma factor [Planctomycetaceae bacterium]|nr:sigma-70 family RNA polymerase sigma factor [Planctomycetaceae bacterium]